jgi:hypothetical protein
LRQNKDVVIDSYVLRITGKRPKRWYVEKIS